jgi:hypothetical protein
VGKDFLMVFMVFGRGGGVRGRFPGVFLMAGFLASIMASIFVLGLRRATPSAPVATGAGFRLGSVRGTLTLGEGTEDLDLLGVDLDGRPLLAPGGREGTAAHVPLDINGLPLLEIPGHTLGRLLPRDHGQVGSDFARTARAVAEDPPDLNAE